MSSKRPIHVQFIGVFDNAVIAFKPKICGYFRSYFRPNWNIDTESRAIPYPETASVKVNMWIGLRILDVCNCTTVLDQKITDANIDGAIFNWVS